MTARRVIRQRPRFFIGCEGESERAYVALLDRLMEEGAPQRVHLLTYVAGGGSATSVIENSITEMERQKRRGGAFRGCVVLLDEDTRAQAHNQIEAALARARRLNFLVVWQRPCHEALLLRHLVGCGNLRPDSTALSIDRLRRLWPDYVKTNTPARQMAERIDRDAILRAAAVEPELLALLTLIGFLG